MTRRAWVALLLAAIVVAVLLSPLASSLPDGLEWIAEHLGFAGREAPAAVSTPLADYSLPAAGLPEPVRTAIAGVVGVLLTFAVAYALARLMKRG